MANPVPSAPELKSATAVDLKGANDATADWMNNSPSGQVGQGIASGETSFRPNYIRGDFLNLMERINPNVNQNLTKAQGQTASNGLTPDKTLRYSRLADALNNRLMWQAATTDNNGNITSGGTAIKMPDISTAETRQQARNEEYEKQYQQNELERQKATRDYPLEQQKLLDQYSNDIAKEYDQKMIGVIADVMGLPAEWVANRMQLNSMQSMAGYNSDYTYRDLLRRADKFMQSDNAWRSALGPLMGIPDITVQAQIKSLLEQHTTEQTKMLNEMEDKHWDEAPEGSWERRQYDALLHNYNLDADSYNQVMGNAHQLTSEASYGIDAGSKGKPKRERKQRGKTSNEAVRERRETDTSGGQGSASN